MDSRSHSPLQVQMPRRSVVEHCDETVLQQGHGGGKDLKEDDKTKISLRTPQVLLCGVMCYFDSCPSTEKVTPKKNTRPSVICQLAPLPLLAPCQWLHFLQRFPSWPVLPSNTFPSPSDPISNRDIRRKREGGGQIEGISILAWRNYGRNGSRDGLRYADDSR